MQSTRNPGDLIKPFQQGKIFAYPTEAVFGLGCDPDNEQAVLRLLALKQRSISKGLILIAADFSQVEKYLKPLSTAQQALTHPSDTTYIFPALDSAPGWLTGDFDSLAVRITRHPLARALCDELNSALVSTSANISGQEPAKSLQDIEQQLAGKIDFILQGDLGNAQKPSVIRDSVTGKVIRA